jgi:hypothetical protein
MLNKDKRSIVLSMVLGDGCLHYIKNKNRIFGGITIDHGLQQADYQAWKAKMLSEIFDRDVKVRTGHKGKSVQVSVCAKRLRAWRKFCYPNGKKSLPKVIKYIRHPELAVAIWLMDDGYVEPSIFKNDQGVKENKSARFRIFTCDQTLEEVEYLVKWFKENFNVNAKIKHHTDSRTKNTYPIIKFNEVDSLIIWNKIRDFVLNFKSMQYKFRYIEQIYQFKFLQRTTGN